MTIIYMINAISREISPPATVHPFELYNNDNNNNDNNEEIYVYA